MNKEFKNILYLQRIQSLEQNSDSELDVCTDSLARLDTVETAVSTFLTYKARGGEIPLVGIS